MEIGWDNGPWCIVVLTILFFVIVIFTLTSAVGKLKEALLDHKQRQHRFVSI